jgi:hypothetical protein
MLSLTQNLLLCVFCVQEKHVKFDTESPEHQEDQRHCPVMELKDIHEGKKDEACGKEVAASNAGLCV